MREQSLDKRRRLRSDVQFEGSFESMYVHIYIYMNEKIHMMRNLCLLQRQTRNEHSLVMVVATERPFCCRSDHPDTKRAWALHDDVDRPPGAQDGQAQPRQTNIPTRARERVPPFHCRGTGYKKTYVSRLFCSRPSIASLYSFL